MCDIFCSLCCSYLVVFFTYTCTYNQVQSKHSLYTVYSHVYVRTLYMTTTLCMSWNLLAYINHSIFITALFMLCTLALLYS